MKKIIIGFLTVLLFCSGSCFAQESNIEIGIRGIAPVMKPVPIQIEASDEYERGDMLVFATSSKEVRVEIPEKNNATDVFPITTTIFVDSEKDTIIYSHIRNDEVIDTYELVCNFSVKGAIGVLKDLGTVSLSSEIYQSYTLRAEDLESLETLRMLEAIYIDNFYTETLGTVEEENLLKWIAEGGTLLVQKGNFEDKNFSGFLKGMASKNSVEYMFGEIIAVGQLDDFLKTYSSQLTYPDVDLNNIRGVSKDGIRLDQQSSLRLIIVFFGVAIIGVLTLWLPKFTKRHFIAVYSGLTLSFFIVMVLMFVKPLMSTTEIHWHKDNARRSLVYLHSMEEESLSVISDKQTSILISDGISTLLNNDSKAFSHLKDELGEQNLVYYERVFSEPEVESLEHTLHLEENYLVGTITWLEDRPLNKGFITVTDEIIPVGRIEPNQKVNVNYRLSDNAADKKNYERQVTLVKNVGWSMSESLVFKEFQQWYQKSNTFKDAKILLGGFQREDNRNVFYVRELSTERGHLNE